MKTSSKDNTSHLFKRYVWLVDTIYRHKKISFDKINDCWRDSSLNDDEKQFPKRTFNNHLEAIRQMFDIEILCDKKAGYTYYIENVDDMEQGGVRSWLLNTFAVNNLINESHKLKHRILFENIPSGQQYLTPIIEAMRDSKTITITYQSFWKDRGATFEVEPYCVKVFRQRWYVVARNLGYNALRTYSLDRISDLEINDKKFKMPRSFDPEEYFAHCFGIINEENKEAEIVDIKVWNGDYNKVKYLKSLPLHSSQKKHKITKEYTIFRYYIKPTFDFLQELLSHSPEIEVLQPEWFRKEIKDIIKIQAKLYKS